MIKRDAVRGVSSWVFGLATTIFLIAMWGRAVVVDVDALREAALPLADSSTVVDIFTEWLDEELVDAGVDPTTSSKIIEDALGRSAVVAAMKGLVGDLVVAAAAPGPGAVVDVAARLEPALPEIGVALDAAGVSVPDARVAEVVRRIDPLVVREPGTEPYVGSASPTASRLGVAAAMSLAVMAVSGWAAVAVSEDRLAEFRGLLNRVALGALSFAILLRAGSWVLDPAGGRAPLRESASLVADSKWLVPVVVGVTAAAAGAAVWAVRRYVRQGGASQSPPAPPTRQRERSSLRSG